MYFRTAYQIFPVKCAYCRFVLDGLAAVILVLILISCSEAPTDVANSSENHSFIEIEERRIPIFPTAEEQLNYTRSWFADTIEKKAALQAFLTLFPEDKASCAMAELDLAYLQLGNDYRLAQEHDGFSAIKAYKDILPRYQKYPEVLAKANWYIGWIYADLLGEKEKATVYFNNVVSKYPQEEVVLLPPAPWVSIIYPDDDAMKTALYNPPKNTWAALALLEIIRNTDDSDSAWTSFIKLWREYRENVATGFGLKLILKRRIHSDEVLPYTREYMEKDFSNVYILSDIQKVIAELGSPEGSADK